MKAAYEWWYLGKNLVYDLRFPFFHGQSGSPVLRDCAHCIILGIVTRSMYSRSESGNSMTGASWAVEAALLTITDST